VTLSRRTATRQDRRGRKTLSTSIGASASGGNLLIAAQDMFFAPPRRELEDQ